MAFFVPLAVFGSQGIVVKCTVTIFLVWSITTQLRNTSKYFYHKLFYIWILIPESMSNYEANNSFWLDYCMVNKWKMIGKYIFDWTT